MIAMLRLAAMLKLSNHQSDRLHDATMPRLGTTDKAGG
jgi:hypothetical protein